MSVIKTNLTALTTQQSLKKTQSSVSTSMERLSSGLRINSAKDDAAGQAIANRMTSQINGLAQAQRNANDGISVSQTAEGGLNQINDNLQRVRELTVQAQNGTNSQDDLTSIQDEINQRLNEINRISEETDFNGTKVLASNEGLQIQVGADDGQTINVGLQQINAETLGLTGFNVDATGTPNDVASQTDLAANGFIDNGDGTFTNSTFNTAGTVGDAISRTEDGDVVTFAPNDPLGTNDVTYTYSSQLEAFTFDETARTDTSGTSLSERLTPEGDEVTSLTISNGAGQETDVNVDSNGNITRASDDAQLYFNGTTGDLTENNQAGSDAATMDDVAAFVASGDAANAGFSISDGTTTFTGDGVTTTGGYNVTSDTITRTELQTDIEESVAANQGFTINNAGGDEQFAYDGTAAAGEQLTRGTDFVYVSGFDDETLTLAAASADAASQTITQSDDGSFTSVINAQSESETVYVTEDGDLSLEAVGDRNVTENPLSTLDSALNQVDSLRSELGAVQNRFESAITNLSTNETNLSDARSRIEDADYAMEVADMTRAQILQQAGTSVLAQANQLPQNVLSLLG